MRAHALSLATALLLLPITAARADRDAVARHGEI